MKSLRLRLESIFKKDFAKNISILVGGTAVAQLIAILAVPILARMYTPEDFSVLAAFSSLLAVIAAVACLRFEIAIPIPKKNKEAMALLVLALASTLMVTLATIFCVNYFYKYIEIITKGKIHGYLWLIPVGVFLIGTYSALQYGASRDRKFSLVARTRMEQAASGASSQIGFGYFGVAPLGLLIGHLISLSFGVIKLGKVFFHTKLKSIRNINKIYLIAVLKKYRKFPTYSTLEAFANAGSINAPVILIAYYAVGAEAGYIMLAMRFISAPIGLIGGAVAQVYLVEAASKYREGQLKIFTKKVMFSLLKVSVIPFFLLAIISPWLSIFVLGQEWERTGILMVWMTPWFLMQFIASPVSMALHITHNQKVAMYLQIFGFILRAGLVLFSGIYFNDYISEVYAVTGFVFYAIYFMTVLAIVK